MSGCPEFAEDSCKMDGPAMAARCRGREAMQERTSQFVVWSKARLHPHSIQRRGLPASINNAEDNPVVRPPFQEMAASSVGCWYQAAFEVLARHGRGAIRTRQTWLSSIVYQRRGRVDDAMTSHLVFRHECQKSNFFVLFWVSE